MPSIEFVVIVTLILVWNALFFRYAPVMVAVHVQITLEVYRDDQLIAARGLAPWEIGYCGDLVRDPLVEQKWINEAIALAKRRGRIPEAAEFSNCMYDVWGTPRDQVIRVNLS